MHLLTLLLHWIVSDKSGNCLVIENTKEKLSIYDNE
ncbi:linear amide C-N hydrolase, partial [Escherichia sp. SP-MK]